MKGIKITRGALIADLRIALCGILIMLFAVLLVLELIPTENTGLRVGEVVRISSASLSPFDAEEKEYSCLLAGSFLNESDADVVVDAVRVVVGDGTRQKTLQLDGFTVPIRSSFELSHTFEDNAAYNRVEALLVVVGGEEIPIFNLAGEAFALTPAILFYSVLIVVVGCLLYVSCKKRYYVWQESRMPSDIL